MAINVTLGEVKTQEEFNYPCLVRFTYPSGTECILLANKDKKAIVLNIDTKENTKVPCADRVGDIWDINEEDKLELVNYPVTLQNA